MPIFISLQKTKGEQIWPWEGLFKNNNNNNKVSKLPNGHIQRISREILRYLGTARNKEGIGYQSHRGCHHSPRWSVSGASNTSIFCHWCHKMHPCCQLPNCQRCWCISSRKTLLIWCPWGRISQICVCSRCFSCNHLAYATTTGPSSIIAVHVPTYHTLYL